MSEFRRRKNETTKGRKVTSFDKLKEECGVFGIWGHPDAAKLTYFGLHSLQHRGQEGAGILSNDAGQLKRHRDMGLLSEVFRDPANLDKLTGKAAIGQYSTIHV